MITSLFKKVAAGLLCLSLLSSVVGLDHLPTIRATDSCVFTDVCDAGELYYEAVSYLKEKGLVKGNPDGSFAPNKKVNRAEVLTILFRGIGGDVQFSAQHSFPDVKEKDWFAPYVSTAKAQGFVKGYPDGTFRAGNEVKLEEATKMVFSFYHIPTPTLGRQANPVNTPLFGNAPANEDLWSEVQDGQWYTPLMKTLHDFKIHSPYSTASDGQFELGQSITRAEVAMILYKSISAKDEISGPLKLISTWDSYQGNMLKEQDAYFYFNKPIKLSTAKKYITLKKYGNEVQEYSLYQTAWIYDLEQMGLSSNYPYLPYELRLDSSVLGSQGTVEITLHKGLEDIYGTTLQEDKYFKFDFRDTKAYLGVSGPSYVAQGQDTKTVLEQENISALTGFLCPVTSDKYLSSFTLTTERSWDRHPLTTTESFLFGGDPKSNTAVQKLCTSPKTSTIETTPSRTKKEFNLNTLFGTLTPGIYFSAFTAPEFYKFRTKTPTARFVYISDTNLTMKTDPKGKSYVWALDMITGKPRANTTLKLYQITRNEELVKKNTYLQSATTDASGKAIFQLPEVGTYPEPEYAVLLEGEGHFGLVDSKWNNGIEPYQYGLDSYTGYWGHSPKELYTVYIHTDRKIYRPGHTVEIKGILRKKTIKGYALPDVPTTLLKITDSEGRELQTKTVKISENGSFTSSLPLAANVSTGSYNITATTATPIQQEQFGEYTTTFEVEEYRKPEFKVDAEVKDSYFNGDTLNTTIQGTYYFGSPVAGGKAHVEISRESLYVSSNTDVWYNFFNTYACYFYCKDTNMLGSFTQDLTLDASGKASLSVPLSLNESSSSGLYTMDISVVDTTGREVHSSKSFKVHKSLLYAGVRSINYMSPVGTAAPFEIYTMNTESKTQSGVPVHVSFYKEDWTSYQTSDISGSMLQNSEHQDKKILETNATTGSDGKAQVSFTPTESGSYYALVEVVDSKGNKSLSRDYMYAYENGKSESYTSWATGDEFKVKLILDAPKYKVGDTAKLMIQSPFEKATALVTVEREEVLDSFIVELPNNSTPISIPVQSAYIPNVYVSVSLFSTTGTPDFRQGYTTLYVDTKDKELGISLSTNKKVYAPREQVEVKISTTDSKGNKVPAEVSLAVVDEAVIALAGGVDRDIMNAFYYFRGIVVDTASSLTHLVQKSLLETVGGSGKGGSSGLPIKRGNMKDTAYWNGTVATNEQGEATISFTLPDNLTHWEILSIGSTKDTKVGSSAISIESHQDIVAQDILPRFVRTGDKVDLTYSVFNMSNGAAVFTATLQSPALGDLPSKQLQLPKDGIGTVTWNVTIPEGESLPLSFSVLGQGLAGDRLEHTLPIHPAQVADAVSSSGRGTGNISTTLNTPDLVASIKESAKASITLSSNPTGTLKKQLEYLNEYPYGCAEQTTSVLRGNILLKKYMDKNALSLPNVTADSLEHNITSSLERIYNYQSETGGWALWGGEEYVDPYLTTYILDTLSQTEEAGFSVDVQVMKKARDYLLKNLSAGKITEEETKAYILYALDKVGVASVATYADTLYATRTTNASSTNSYLLLLYSSLQTKGNTQYSSRIRALSSQMENAVDHDTLYAWIRSSSTDYYSYYSYDDVEKNALALRALSLADPAYTYLESMMAHLVASSQEDRWANTHSTMHILSALDTYMGVKGTTTEAFTAEVKLNGTLVGTASFAPGGVSDGIQLNIPASSLAANTQKLSITAPAGKTVYYQFGVTYLKSAKDQYVPNDHLTMKRSIEYYTADGSLSSFPHPLKVGEKVRVTLSLLQNYTNPEHKKLAIEDYLPAGLEALNPGIRTTGKTETSFTTGWADHVEMRDDRVLLYLEDARNVTFSYDAQVISSGTFSYPAVHAFEMYNPGVYTKSGAGALVTSK